MLTKNRKNYVKAAMHSQRVSAHAFYALILSVNHALQRVFSSFIKNAPLIVLTDRLLLMVDDGGGGWKKRFLTLGETRHTFSPHKVLLEGLSVFFF